MTTLETLRTARARIDTPDKWWKASAPDACFNKPDGTPTDCALLAIDRQVVPGDVQWSAKDALVRAIGGRDHGAIPEFNDTHSHAEVLAAFDCAIANERAREQEFTGDLIIDETRAPERV